MAKVIKLKLSDIEEIVKRTINEAEFDDFDTKVQPEELPGYKDYVAQGELEKDMENEEQPQDTSDIVIGKDQQGNIVVVDSKSGNILGQK